MTPTEREFADATKRIQKSQIDAALALLRLPALPEQREDVKRAWRLTVQAFHPDVSWVDGFDAGEYSRARDTLYRAIEERDNDQSPS